MMRHKDFGAFILTHGRADRVYTVDTLKQSGYTGPLVFVIDDEDDQRQLYFENFGRENVVIFSKSEVVKTFDEGDNFNDRRAIIYARNACFEIARERGFKYFIELDDDYTNFSFRFDEDRIFTASTIRDLDRVLDLMLDYYISMPNCLSLAMAQGGDYIGGGEGTFGKEIRLHRKAMNSFICSVDRPFKFVGRVNEDVNTYTSEGFRGGLFLTVPQVCLNQKQTQSNPGGMSEMYIDSGTYVKTFYSVMYHPSGVKVGAMGSKALRLHHQIDWRATVPQIVSEDVSRKWLEKNRG